MTRGDWVARVARKIGLDTTAGSDELTFLQDTFFDAIKEVLLETHCYVDIGDMTLTSGVSEYRTDSNILAIMNNRETSQGQQYGLWPEVVTLSEILHLQASTQSGSPVQKMAIEGNLLVVWPTPNQADVIRWMYVPLPTKPTQDTHDSSNPTYGGIPVMGDRALEYYGLWQASEYDEKKMAEGPKDYAQQFQDECGKLRKRLRHMRGRGLQPARVGYPGARTRVVNRNDVYPKTY